MTKRYPGRKKRRGNRPILSLGIGLLLVVAVLYFGLRDTENAPLPQDFSTIPVEVNYPAPELELENVNGGFESLSDFRDQVVLVNNWATWCPPCKAELPTLVAFYNAHAEQGFTIIGIEAGEAAEAVAGFAREYRISYPVWLDPNNRALAAFRNQNLPNSYVIDRKGTVRLAWTGEINRDTLEKYVTPLIAEK
jgi:peroxiredoxin